MTGQIQAEHLTNARYMLLDETFDNVHGFVLDKGTSMFEIRQALCTLKRSER